ncbi:hypothetical protein AZE42_06207 [Rhizopogon vesiculosus]|uniref:Uncharacterized protein n=1 Tax=Rhizopogon vesiculosus TaxID=180088 RepID=A0A1J8R358_9AGAM|nr:hypothetical protein AZE42_06207 [Rhizopogon vesiculosus]
MIDLRTCTPKTASAPSCIWNKDTANAVPAVCSRYIDETQDLMITVNTLNDNPHTSEFTYRINFRTMYTDKEHPLAQGSRLVNGRTSRPEDTQRRVAVTVLGDRLAFYSNVLQSRDEEDYHLYRWSLHVLNWHMGDQPDDKFMLGESYDLVEIRFLTEEKLLALTTRAEIELYNVEDLSKAPQLQARFMLPVIPQSLLLRYPSVFHSTPSCARLTAPGDRWIWTTNPADRVICVMTVRHPLAIFVIHARLFFMDIPLTWFDTTSKDGRAIPWSTWGPQSSRCFPQALDIPFLSAVGYRFGVGGSRVMRVVEHRMHMTDFNPSAVARGIGKDVTTYLPYVEVVNSDRNFAGLLEDIILDEEKVLIFIQNYDDCEVMDVEIIDL